MSRAWSDRWRSSIASAVVSCRRRDRDVAALAHLRRASLRYVARRWQTGWQYHRLYSGYVQNHGVVARGAGPRDRRGGTTEVHEQKRPACRGRSPRDHATSARRCRRRDHPIRATLPQRRELRSGQSRSPGPGQPSLTTLLVDTSVLIKWFHSEGESQVTEARALREAARRGEVETRVIDLALYEMGNVLLRSLSWSGSDVADQLDDLVLICGSPLAVTADWFRQAAIVASANDLTFYDACWAASAQALGVSLVSSDDQLLDAGLAESPQAVALRLRL